MQKYLLHNWRWVTAGMAGAGILALAHAGKHNSRQATATGEWLLRYSFDEYNREVQFGQGVHQRRIRATMTSQTSALAVDIASDKELTARLLGAAGLLDRPW